MEATLTNVGLIVTASLVVFNMAVGGLKKTGLWKYLKKQIDPIRVALGGVVAVLMNDYLVGMTGEMMVMVSSSFAAGSWVVGKGTKQFKKKG